MRLQGLALFVVALAGSPVAAQQAQPQRPAGPAAPATAAAPTADPALDQHLLRWEQEMQRVQSLAALLNLTERDKTFRTEQKFSGFAQYLKAGNGPGSLNMAMLELRQPGRQEIARKYICSGTFLYEFLPAQKEIRAHQLPPPKPGQVADDNFLSFLFGMKASEARRRYDLRLAKEDQYYIYVDIAPRDARDRADFQRARIVLNRDSYLPRQLWFEHANGNEVLWDIPRIQNGARVNRADFDAPRPPAGWRLSQVPLNGEVPPRVARPSP